MAKIPFRCHGDCGYVDSVWPCLPSMKGLAFYEQDHERKVWMCPIMTRKHKKNKKKMCSSKFYNASPVTSKDSSILTPASSIRSVMDSQVSAVTPLDMFSITNACRKRIHKNNCENTTGVLSDQHRAMECGARLGMTMIGKHMSSTSHFNILAARAVIGLHVST